MLGGGEASRLAPVADLASRRRGIAGELSRLLAGAVPTVSRAPPPRPAIACRGCPVRVTRGAGLVRAGIRCALAGLGARLLAVSRDPGEVERGPCDVSGLGDVCRGCSLPGEAPVSRGPGEVGLGCGLPGERIPDQADVETSLRFTG